MSAESIEVPVGLHWVQRPGSRIERVLRPRTLAEAARLLAEQPERRPVAGGTDLLLDLARDDRGRPVDLLDLSRVDELQRLEFRAGECIEIGAGVTHNTIVADDRSPDVLLPLAQACLEVGSPQLRNRATVAGNLVTASPTNDTISALLALDASITIAAMRQGQLHRRTVGLDTFFTGFRQTVLEPGELVELISVPWPGPFQRGIWVKVGLRRAQAISVVHAGFTIDVADDETVTAARIALGSVAPTVVLSEPAADVLVGHRLSDSVIAAAAEAAAKSVSPIDDGRATAEYRRSSVETVVARALTSLAAGRQRERWPERIPTLTVSEVDPARPGSDVVAAETEIRMQLNGDELAAPVGDTPVLLDWLREHAGTGTKEGCAEGECGACTVALDGQAVMSCLVPTAQADGARVTTIEGLGRDALDPMQQAFIERFAVQCGYCIPGFVMAARALVDELGTPTRDEIELALSGNLCRCTGYYNIIDAVLAAAEGAR